MDRDSSLGIVTGYGLDGPGDRIPLEARFSATVQTVRGANPTSYITIIIIIIIIIIPAIGLSPGGSGYFTCKQNMKLVTNKFKSGGLHEKHVVATWNVGNHLSICL